MENLGFWKKGEGGKKIKELSTMYGNGGSLIVNTSGGLKAAGHPVGATGIKQIGEIFLQMTEQAEKRQVRNVKYGLAHNVGGSGGTAVVTILAK
jgi:acetyl-CoA C-acetyltransferase